MDRRAIADLACFWHTARLAENRPPGDDLYRFAIKRPLKSYLDDYDLPDRVSEAYPANVQSLVLRQANSRNESSLHNNRDTWFHHHCQFCDVPIGKADNPDCHRTQQANAAEQTSGETQPRAGAQESPAMSA